MAHPANKKQKHQIKDVYAVGKSANVYDNASDDVNYMPGFKLFVQAVGGHNAGGGDVESNGAQGQMKHLWLEHGINPAR